MNFFLLVALVLLISCGSETRSLDQQQSPEPSKFIAAPVIECDLQATNSVTAPYWQLIRASYFVKKIEVPSEFHLPIEELGNYSGSLVPGSEPAYYCNSFRFFMQDGQVNAEQITKKVSVRLNKYCNEVPPSEIQSTQTELFSVPNLAAFNYPYYDGNVNRLRKRVRYFSKEGEFPAADLSGPSQTKADEKCQGITGFMGKP